MLKQGANIRGGLDTVMIVSFYGKSVDWIQRIGRLSKDGDKEGRIIIFVTLETQEEKWFKKMVDKIDMSVFNVVKHADAESFIKRYVDERR
jgi:ERCC4-related helicase